MSNFLKNYFSTLSFLGILFAVYNYHAAFTQYTTGEYSFFYHTLSISAKHFFLIIIGCYIIFLIPFYLIYTQPSKARILYQYIWKKWYNRTTVWTKLETNALLGWIVKWFFWPIMIYSILHYGNIGYVFFSSDAIPDIWSRHFFDVYFYPTAISILFLIDLLPFIWGYCLEGKVFGNTIRSVNPYLSAWCFALVCYYPFSYFLDLFFWYSVHTYPVFSNTYIHIFFWTLLLIFIGIYSRASVALGLKASNLTNRGIVSRGPYAYIRHPAYICKNIARWIGILPFLIQAIREGNISQFFILFLWISGITFVYYMRALSEEWHLNADVEYLDYKKKVPHRFFPW